MLSRLSLKSLCRYNKVGQCEYTNFPSTEYLLSRLEAMDASFKAERLETLKIIEDNKHLKVKISNLEEKITGLEESNLQLKARTSHLDYEVKSLSDRLSWVEVNHRSEQVIFGGTDDVPRTIQRYPISCKIFRTYSYVPKKIQKYPVACSIYRAFLSSPREEREAILDTLTQALTE